MIDTESLITLLKYYDLFKNFESLPDTTISSLASFYVHDFVHLLDTKRQPLEEEYYEVLILYKFGNYPFYRFWRNA